MSATRVPAPTIVAQPRPGDAQLLVRFDPRAPLALTEVLVPGEAALSPEEYLGLVTAAATRLVLYSQDFRAAMYGNPDTDDGNRASRRPRKLAGGHCGHGDRRRRQAHAYRPLPWAGRAARRCP